MPAKIKRTMADDGNVSVVGSTAILDMGPVHVRGSLRARFARVIWADGMLYVVSHRGGKIERLTIATEEPVQPETRDGQWIARSELGAVRWSRKGCSG